jgi:hypothetical protein
MVSCKLVIFYDGLTCTNIRVYTHVGEMHKVINVARVQRFGMAEDDRNRVPHFRCMAINNVLINERIN